MSGPSFADAFVGPEMLPLSADDPDVVFREFERNLYGPIPAPPDSFAICETPLEADRTSRIVMTLRVGQRRFAVDAALFRPPETTRPVPTICALDFLGPVGIMVDNSFPVDPKARVHVRPEYGATDGRLDESLRGAARQNWPIEAINAAGYAVLVSCYGSWTPDHPRDWNQHGVGPLTNSTQGGAISFWAWAFQRLLDAVTACDGLDEAKVQFAGHSRLGKAALWAAASDGRVAGVFANQSGCAGASPAVHGVGETMKQLTAGFPHWPAQPHPTPLDYDQQDLINHLGAKAVYLGQAKDDLWADPLGSYLALTAGATERWPPPSDVWENPGQIMRGRKGYHLRDGGHGLSSEDWMAFLTFLEHL